MFPIRAAPSLVWRGADIPRKLILSSGRLGFSPLPRCREHVSSRVREAALLLRAGQPGKGGRNIHSSAAANDISVNFDLTQEAYRSKDSLELLRSLVVFKLCSYDFMVDNNQEVKSKQQQSVAFLPPDQLDNRPSINNVYTYTCVFTCKHTHICAYVYIL